MRGSGLRWQEHAQESSPRARPTPASRFRQFVRVATGQRLAASGLAGERDPGVQLVVGKQNPTSQHLVGHRRLSLGRAAKSVARSCVWIDSPLISVDVVVGVGRVVHCEVTGPLHRSRLSSRFAGSELTRAASDPMSTDQKVGSSSLSGGTKPHLLNL